MKKSFVSVSVIALLATLLGSNVLAKNKPETSASSADDSVAVSSDRDSFAQHCNQVFAGKWNVKKAADIKKHIKHRLKIEQTGNNNYSVKIKNDDGDTTAKSVKDFSLTCSSKSEGAKLSGDVKMGKCVHAMEIGLPYHDPKTGKDDFDKIYIKINTIHSKGECRGHKDTLHDGDRLNHKQVAYGKRVKK